MAKLDSGAMTIGNNDNWREIFDDQNATAQAADRATQDLAPIVKGKQCAAGAAEGDYVLLRGSTISGCADGAYRAAKPIPAATDIDGTYLEAVTGGIANALNSKMPGFLVEHKQYSQSVSFSLSGNTAYLLILSATDIAYCGLWLIRVGSTGNTYAFKVTIGTTGTGVTVTTGSYSVSLTNNNNLSVQAVAIKLY